MEQSHRVLGMSLRPRASITLGRAALGPTYDEAAGWTWRLELDCPEPGQLELRLYTTSPQGEEELAASSEYRR